MKTAAKGNLTPNITLYTRKTLPVVLNNVLY